jgi:octaprenyl-diphosphate synthase
MWAAESKSLDEPRIERSPREAQVTWKTIVHAVQPFLDQVGGCLREQIQAFDPETEVYAQYALTNQGKQLRPALVALSAHSIGKTNDHLVTAAAIVEMVHLATLVHDDIMDAAETRRGRPTVAANWGNEISVLLGDCLFAQALQLAASFPTPEVCRLVASATKTVCSGEILQTRNCYRFDLGRAEYFRILSMKTGALFALSCDLGGTLAGATVSQREALRNYGLALGTAYQIYDDCLDVFGTETKAGKSLGTDLANGKLTLPLLVLLERATIPDKNRAQLLLESFERTQLSEVTSLLEKYDALEESQRVVCDYCEQARQSVQSVSFPGKRDALEGLTRFLAQLTGDLGVVR